MIGNYIFHLLHMPIKEKKIVIISIDEEKASNSKFTHD